jgi:hypothetical protein
MKLNCLSSITPYSVFLAATVLAPSAESAPIEFFDYVGYVAAMPHRTIVNFDDVPSGTAISANAYAGLTVAARRIIAVNPQDFAPGLSVGGANVNSQQNGISASIFYSGSSLGFDNLDDNFTFTLASPTPAAGLWIGNVGNSNNDPHTPTTVTFYSESGTVIASEIFRQGHVGQIGTGANNRFFYGVVSDMPVSSFSVVNAASDRDGIILDDIQWASSVPEPAPEPAPVTMLLLGLTYLAFRHRYA